MLKLTQTNPINVRQNEILFSKLPLVVNHPYHTREYECQINHAVRIHKQDRCKCIIFSEDVDTLFPNAFVFYLEDTSIHGFYQIIFAFYNKIFNKEPAINGNLSNVHHHLL